MKKALPVEIKYIHIPDHDNDEKLRKVYFRLFNLAREILIEEKRKKNTENNG